MELWDAYDRNLKKIEGITLIRGEESSIPKGTGCGTESILYNAGQALLQYKIQRDKTRYLYILSCFQGLTAGMRRGLFLSEPVG